MNNGVSGPDLQDFHADKSRFLEVFVLGVGHVGFGAAGKDVTVASVLEGT